jgi:formate hydrogenlyase transcriptional activator
VQFFVQKYAGRVGRRVESVDLQTMARLTSYSWPGNIRELENIIERALILSSSPMLEIEPEVLGIPAQAADHSAAGNGVVAPGVARAPAPRGGAEPDTADLDSVQRGHILAMLRETNWVIEGPLGAAARLGMKPGTLRHRMKKLGISRGAD